MRGPYRLVDVLVATSVIGFMVGLLLPAFNAADNSHGMTGINKCRYYLKQIAVGLIQYEAAFGRFPPSLVESPGPGGPTSYLVTILPYVDQTDLFHTYNHAEGPESPTNIPVTCSPIRVFSCPDASGPVFPDTALAPSNYAANWGGGREGFGADFVARHGTNRGVMGSDWSVRPGDIKDGAGMTILVGEKPGAFPWAVGGFAASEFDVGPSPKYAGADPLTRKVYTGSAHAGVTNFAFCDGSVRAIRDGTAREVWYALITRDGGEKVDWPLE